MEWKLTHYYEVEDEHYIFWVLGVLPKLCWTEPGVGDHDRCVGAVLVKHPLLGLDVNGLDLEELDDVVEDGEGDDGEDVAETVAHVAMLERQTHGHEPLNRHGNNLWKMSSSCEHFVSLQFSESLQGQWQCCSFSCAIEEKKKKFVRSQNIMQGDFIISSSSIPPVTNQSVME